MIVTPETIVAGVEPGDIDRARFISVQLDAGSPASSSAGESYDALRRLNVSIAFLLAVFHHESTYATNPNAIVVKYQTNNPGNCRSSRTGDYPIVSTPRGPFVDYPTWLAGWRDLSYRLTDPTYVYVQENRRTIRRIIERFAPPTDNNDPDAYVNAVVSDMNRWIASESMSAQVPGFTWVPEQAGEYGYPPATHGRNGRTVDRLIIHCTLGTDSLAHLIGGNGNSVQFLDWRDGRPRAQMIPIQDAAWGAGNREYNLRAINYEHEATKAEMLDPRYWTNVIIDNMAKNGANIIRACPEIKPDRAHVIGHGEVPDQDHYDPGPVFPWGRYIDALNRELYGASPAPDDALYLPGNPYGEIPVIAGFKAWLETQGRARSSNDVVAGMLSITGYPQASEVATPFGSAQPFERCVLLWYRDTAPPWDIVLSLRSWGEIKRESAMTDVVDVDAKLVA